MGIAKGGVVIRTGGNLYVAGMKPSGIAAGGQVVYRKPVVAGPWQLVAHVGAAALTSPAINTTGANLLVASISTYSTPIGRVTGDTYGNTWYEVYSSAGSIATSTLYYAFGTKVGPSHTFTITGAYSSFQVAAFSGASAFPVFQAVGNNSARPGPLNVLQTSLCISSAGCNTNIVSISGGFSMIDNQPYQAQNMAAAMASLWLAAPGMVDPTWTPQAPAQFGTTLAAFY